MLFYIEIKFLTKSSNYIISQRPILLFLEYFIQKMDKLKYYKEDFYR